MEYDEFRKISEELCGYIPDTSSEILCTIGTRLNNVEGADPLAAIGRFNNKNQRNVRTNEKFNEKFLRKTKQYNYSCSKR